uniref:Ethylene-responsive transcription factor ERF018 n=1 Tax=Elaeis guineensis var. tenera TaxID=51953 RepID=A0A6I9S5E8_ELAGV|nr:ethylene-responsive transcription factor ERF018 [Elaeis guineensis]
MKPAAKRRRTAKIRFGGVRKRRWGKWVLEIRLRHSRKRIWLGSYDCPEKAGRAFDAVARFNFPDHPPDSPAAVAALSPQSVQPAAAHHANRPSQPPPQHSTADYLASAVPESSSDGCLAVHYDRSFADLVMAATADAEFAAFENGFVYELFPAAAPPLPDPEEENWGGAFDPCLILWNF